MVSAVAIKGGETSLYPLLIICVSSIKLDSALSNNANLSLTKTNREPVVFVAKSKSNISKSSPNL